MLWIRYICRLNEEVQILEGGNLEYQVSVEGNDEITDLAKSMNRMKESFITIGTITKTFLTGFVKGGGQSHQCQA